MASMINRTELVFPINRSGRSIDTILSARTWKVNPLGRCRSPSKAKQVHLQQKAERLHRLQLRQVRGLRGGPDLR